MILPWLLLITVFSLLAQATRKPRAGVPSSSFSLRVAQTGHGKRGFVRDWAAARQKWGAGVPEEVVSTFSLADSDGRVDVHPMGSDALFIANVGIGDPPQMLKMALDTGSSDLWVQSSDTDYSTNDDGPWAPRYMPNESDTSHMIPDARWGVQYVDGSGAEGIVYSDTVQLGNFKVHEANIQSAQTLAAQFEREVDLSGIIGLAKSLPSNIDPPTPTFLDLLRTHLDQPVFTADLQRNATGRFDFGYIDTSLASDNITWLDSVSDSPHWDIKLDLTAWVGGSGDGTWWYREYNATVDTGTTLLFLPNALVTMYWFAVPGVRVDPRLSDAYIFPCDIANNLPDLLFKLPGTEHVLRVPGSYLNYGPVSDEDGMCWGGLQSADGLSAVILGDIMLKALFVAFDLAENRIGLANKVLRDA